MSQSLSRKMRRQMQRDAAKAFRAASKAFKPGAPSESRMSSDKRGGESMWTKDNVSAWISVTRVPDMPEDITICLRGLHADLVPRFRALVEKNGDHPPLVIAVNRKAGLILSMRPDIDTSNVNSISPVYRGLCRYLRAIGCEGVLHIYPARFDGNPGEAFSVESMLAGSGQTEVNIYPWSRKGSGIVWHEPEGPFTVEDNLFFAEYVGRDKDTSNWSTDSINSLTLRFIRGGDGTSEESSEMEVDSNDECA